MRPSGQYFGRVDLIKIHNYLLPHSNHSTGSYNKQPHYLLTLEVLMVIMHTRVTVDDTMN